MMRPANGQARQAKKLPQIIVSYQIGSDSAGWQATEHIISSTLIGRHSAILVALAILHHDHRHPSHDGRDSSSFS